MRPVGSWRVLILEDEPIIGLALEDMLESLGVKSVLHAATLPAARDVVETADLDWAILDVNIHGERSYPIADTLLALRVPFIFATGYGDTQHPPQHLHTRTLVKPYSMSDLRAEIERLGS
jgi:DNA-binding response OmpR family regulator